MTLSIEQSIRQSRLPPPKRRLKVLLTSLGSHGDLHPFIAAAAALRARGHEAAVIANSHFEREANNLGVPLISSGPSEEYEEALASVKHGMHAVIEVLVTRTIPRVYQAIAERYEPGSTVVLGSAWSFGARIAEDRLGVATASMVISPQTMMSACDPAEIPRAIPVPLRRWLLRYIERKVLDPALMPPVNQAREKVELKPVDRIQTRWLFAPRRAICLWPEWYARPVADWPQQARTTGFVLYDGAPRADLPEKLKAFLAAGSPPIAFVTCSGMRDAGAFFDESVRACQRLGERGLLLSKDAERLPPSLPDSIIHVDYAPFAKVIPRCRAVVHQGAIGTAAFATSAGLPQIAVPYGMDQPDNATRLARLGICRVIRPNRYTGERVAKHLGKLLRSHAVARQCEQLAEKMRLARPLDDICRMTEALAEDVYGRTGSDIDVSQHSAVTMS